MKDLIRMQNDVPFLDAETSLKIGTIERAVKQLKEQEEKLKKAILDEMERKGIIKIETDDLVITYIAETEREKFDTRKFRLINPDYYDEYCTLIPVKSSIRIKVK